MKHALILTALAAAVAIGTLPAHSFAQSGDTSSLKAENNMLKKQVETLKAQLEAARKLIDDLKAKLKAATGSDSPAPSKTAPTTQAADDGFHLRLHEDCDKWWTDPRPMMFDIALRGFISTQYPDQSATAWMDRQKYFVGRELTWKMNVRSIQDVSGIAARSKYRRYQKSLEGIKTRIERCRKTLSEAGKSDDPRHAARSKTEMKNALASLQKEQAFALLWEQLNEARGGAIVQLSLNSARGRGRGAAGQLTVHLALTGDEAMETADINTRAEATVSGKIVCAWIERDRNISVVIKGKITQEKKPKTDKTKRKRTERYRERRPERFERRRER